MLVKFEQIRMVRTLPNFELFDKNVTKCWRHFERRFCDWNNSLMQTINLKTIVFQCSKKYGSSTTELQSWTKIVGTLVHNSDFFRYSISILNSPPFNVVLLWTRRANCIAYHVWLQHWFRGVGSVKCPSIIGQDCLRRVKKLPINLTKMLITLKRHKQMLWFFLWQQTYYLNYMKLYQL